VVGVAEISKAAYPDPGDPAFVAVSVQARHPLQRPVTLKQIKAAPGFAEWEMVRLPQLSVMPVTAEHWQAIHALA
jgi:predicted RNA-binding protein with PUA-like domain